MKTSWWPSLIEAIGGDPDGFAVTGTAGDRVGAAGGDDRTKQRDLEQFRLGHEGHGAPQGMAQEWWI